MLIYYTLVGEGNAIKKKSLGKATGVNNFNNSSQNGIYLILDFFLLN